MMHGHGPIIIGSACGALVVLIVIVIAIICLMRRRRKKRRKSNGTENARDDLWVDMSGRDQRYKLPSPSLMSLPSLDEETVTPDKNDNSPFYHAIHDYTALQDGHLNLSKGDRVQLLETADGGWCRGVSHKDGQSGWFPNSYVVQEHGSDKDDKDGLTSRGSTPSKIPPVYVSSFQIKKTENEYATPVVFDSVPSYASLERKRVGGANDVVASWVKMASSVSMSSIPSVDSAATGSALEDFNNPSMKGHHFRAIYAYKPVCKGEMGLREGELLVCKEKDKNGWMLGFKPQTKEEGWFPAVYVDEVQTESDPLCYTNVPATYDILDSNKLHSTSQPWTGIEHKSVSEYSSDVPGDLNFRSGDDIVVYQTLANGWWFGATRDKSGWFPGAFVKMASEDENQGATSGLSCETDGNSRPSTPCYSSPSLGDINILLRHKHIDDGVMSNNDNSAPNSALNSPRESIASSIYSENDRLPLMTHKPKGANNGPSKKIRPNRKAPAPPPVMALKAKLAHQIQDGVNSLRRPARPAPAPPTMKDVEKSMKTSPPDNIHKSSDSLNNNNNDNNKPKKLVVLINGRKPKLIKTKPSTFDDKCLNPMIRPAKRGFAPTPEQYRIEKSTKPNRLSLTPSLPPNNSRHSFTSDYSIPMPTTPVHFSKKNNYPYPDNHHHRHNNNTTNLTRSSPTSSMDSGMDVRMQRPYTPTHPSPLAKSFNEYDRIPHDNHTHAERESSPSMLLHRSNTSTPTAFHRLTPRHGGKRLSNNYNINISNDIDSNHISPPYPPSIMSSSSSHNLYSCGTPSITMNGDATGSGRITPHDTDHYDSIQPLQLDPPPKKYTTHDLDPNQPAAPSVSTFLSPNQNSPRSKTNSPRPGPKPSPKPNPNLRISPNPNSNPSPRVSPNPKPNPSPRVSPKPNPTTPPKPSSPIPTSHSNEITKNTNLSTPIKNNNNNNINNHPKPEEDDFPPPPSPPSDKDAPTPENMFRPIDADPQSPGINLHGHKLLRYSDGTELDRSSKKSNFTTGDSFNENNNSYGGGHSLSLSPAAQEHSVGSSPVYQEPFLEETTSL